MEPQVEKQIPQQVPPQIPQGIHQEVHGHLNKLVFLIFFLLVLGAIGTWLGFRFINNDNNPAVTEETAVIEAIDVKPLIINDTDTPAIKQRAIVNRAGTASSIPLTPEERAMILKEFSPDNISQYNLSDAERKVILEALNRQ